MNQTEFDQVAASFAAFHREFAPLFGRKQPGLQCGSGRATVVRPARHLAAGEPGPVAVQALAAQLPESAWHALTVAKGAQGPCRYQFASQRVWEHREGVPGRACWLVLRRNLDGSELKYYFSNAPADTPLLTLAQVGAVRWVIETEFQTYKGEAGLDEYEARSWPSLYHHITMAMLAGAFLLTLEQDWGEKLPQITRPQISRVLRHLLPQRKWTLDDLQHWLVDTQERNQRSKRSHTKRRQARRAETSL